MRRKVPLSLVLAGCLALSACDKPVPDTRPAAPASPAPPSGPLAIVTSPIDTTITLGNWMSSHPGDVVQDSVPVGALRGLVCRISVAPMQVGGRPFVRQALFMSPSPPEGEVLPDTARLAEQRCHLWGIWLVTTESDSARGLGFADSLAHLLNTSLGASRPGVSLRESFTSSWMGARSWTGPGTKVMLGMLKAINHLRREDRETEEADRDGRVILASIAPHSGFDSLALETRAVDTEHEDLGERDLELARADSALDWTALPALVAEVRPIFALFRTTTTFDSLQKLAFDSALVHVARTVRTVGPKLEPSRRAALLFAGDVLFDRAVHERNFPLDEDDDSLTNALKATGAPFDFAHQGSREFYTRRWLDDAYHQDSLSHAGHAALVSLLGRGWSDDVDCDGSTDRVDAVIAHGNAALKRGEADPSISYYLGLANTDLLVINEDASMSQLRSRALEHFRTALAGPLDRRMRRHAWRMAVALMLGHTLDTTYYCVDGD